MKLFNSHLPSLTEIQLLELDIPLTLVELDRALGEMGSGKTPGIDDQEAEFFLAFWELLHPQLLNVIQESLRSSVMR